MSKQRVQPRGRRQKQAERVSSAAIRTILYRLTIVLIGVLFAATSYAGAVLMLLLEHQTVPHLIAMFMFVYGLVATAAWIADCWPKKKRKKRAARRAGTR